MKVVEFSRVSLPLFFVKFCLWLECVRWAANAEMCAELSKDPYFNIEQVLGEPWRIYYTWNVMMENKCKDMTFKKPTVEVIKRVYHDMHYYLETQPPWASATLHATLGNSSHEMLLFPDEFIPGSFIGVPNIAKDRKIIPPQGAMPLYKFFIKLVHSGRYLLMVDCGHIAVASLCSREHPPYRSELVSVANSLSIGEGVPACVRERNKDEHLYFK